MEHNNKLILIGFAEALSAPEVAWCLLDAGFRVVAFTTGKHKLPLRRCRSIDLVKVTAPGDDVFRTISELRSIYKTLHAAAIMPLNDGALWICSNLASESEVVVAGPTGERAQLALDKRLQLKAAQDAGFNVPYTLCINNVDDIAKITIFPIVLKPALAIMEQGGRLIKSPLYFCANRHELDMAIKTWDCKQPLLAQSIHKGIGEGLFGLATHTGIHAWSAHRRIRMMNPKGSGSSACRGIFIIDQPLNIAEQMLLKANWRGMFMIELLRDESDKIWFMELNGRSWGSMALALRMGFKYPVWTIMQTFNSSFYPKPPAAREFITCRHLGRELIHLLQVLRGPSSSAIPEWPSIWHTFFTVLRISKNDQWYNWRSGYTALFLEDIYYTILNETLRKWLK